MTRKEQILQAARDYVSGVTLSSPSDVIHFEYGARWADEHPVNVWHDTNEEPRCDELLLTEESDDFNLYKLCREEDNTSKTWEEYCKLTKGSYSNYANATTNMVYKDRHTGAYNEFSTRERAEQFIAFGKLLQLRDYWVGDWKRNSDNIYVIYKNVIMAAVHNNDFPLTFPTREMAKEFKDCFSDLIKEAYPLV